MKLKKRWVILLLLILLILCAVIFRDRIVAFLYAAFVPIGPGGLPETPI